MSLSQKVASGSGLSADKIFRAAMTVGLIAAAALALCVAGTLLFTSLPLWGQQSPLTFLTEQNWLTGITQADGSTLDIYGAAAMIYGTIATGVLAIVIAAPIGIAAAIYLVELAPRRLSATLAFIVELIAAIPSVVIGLWAVGDLSLRIRDSIEWWIASSIGKVIPLFSEDPTSPASDSIFRAGFVLAIMILPMVVAVSREVIRSVPVSLREGYIGMGATRWETIRDIILPAARVGLVGGVLLALGRALGETIAVTMVIGNADAIPGSLFLPGQTIASKIANTFGEASGPIQYAALAALGLCLYLVSLGLSIAVRLIARRSVVSVREKR